MWAGLYRQSLSVKKNVTTSSQASGSWLREFLIAASGMAFPTIACRIASACLACNPTGICRRNSSASPLKSYCSMKLCFEKQNTCSHCVKASIASCIRSSIPGDVTNLPGLSRVLPLARTYVSFRIALPSTPESFRPCRGMS